MPYDSKDNTFRALGCSCGRGYGKPPCNAGGVIRYGDLQEEPLGLGTGENPGADPPSIELHGGRPLEMPARDLRLYDAAGNAASGLDACYLRQWQFLLHGDGNRVRFAPKSRAVLHYQFQNVSAYR